MFVDSSSVPLSPQFLRTNSDVFSSLVTYGPVKQHDELHLLQHHYKRAELEVSLATTRALELEVKELCNSKSGSFYPPSSEEDCTVSVCSCQSSSSTAHCPSSGAIPDIPPEFESRTIYDYYPWEYFDVKMIYEEASVQPSFKLKLKRNTKMELQQALTRAIQKSCKEHGKPLKFKKLVNGWLRHNPYVGSEYIIDYLLTDGSNHQLSHRVNLVRPLATNFIATVKTFNTHTNIRFLVPLSKVTARFKEFMRMYETLVLAEEQEAELVLCVYGASDVKEVGQLVEEYRQRYQNMQVKVLEGKGQFTRARALDLGFSSLTPHQLAFVCDVDMTITKSFLDRCRSNTVEGKRVYYPEFFKLYNMEYVYWNRNLPPQTHLQRQHGHWAYYSFGMLCIYKSDYVKVGGFDTNIVGWGGEDVLLFNKIVRSRMKVLRAPDVALSHRWHTKECSSSLSRRQFKQCQSSREENLADRRELARYLYERGLVKTAAELTTPLTTPLYHPMAHKLSRQEQVTHQTLRKALNMPIKPIGADYDI